METNVNRRDELLPLFLRLYNSNYRSMYLFTKTLFPTERDVDDILQDVSMALWKKFDTFQEGSDFTAWAFQMIRLEVLESRRKKSRQQVLFDSELLDTIAEELVSWKGLEWNRRFDALNECSQKLPKHFRNLIDERYFKGISPSLIAKRSNRSLDAVYRQLSRIRAVLKECVMKSLLKTGNH